MDSKGRILLPALFRKNLGIENGSEVGITYSLREASAVLFFGQDSVEANTGDCGSPVPSSNSLLPQGISEENPGSDPPKTKGGEL